MKLHNIDTGLFKLDGGAMFGVVPKSMWSKLNPPDNNNMCTWSMKSLLIEEGDKLILIDTGMGNKQDEKFRSHFYPHGTGNLIQSLANIGVTPEDITDVILTHLHFDHCGGAVARDGEKLYTQFPKATYWSNQDHWNWALHPNDREKASFLKENILPIQESGQLKFISADTFQKYGLDFDFVFGHTEAMTITNINYNGQLVVFASDLMPSSYHIPMPYIMGYDIRPLNTLTEKEKLFERVLTSKGMIFFQHDPVHELGTLKVNDKGRVELDQLILVNQL